jgi:hypothetical protein
VSLRSSVVQLCYSGLKVHAPRVPGFPEPSTCLQLLDSSAPRWPCWLCWQLQLDGELQSDRIRKMAQRWGCAALALAQVRIRDRQELDFVGNCTCTYCTYTWLALVLYPYCTRTLCFCHATQCCSPPTKAAPVHLNPEHPRIPVIQTRFQ